MLSRIAVASAVVIAIVGWGFAAYQLDTDRWPGSSGLLMIAAAGATFGASVVVPAVLGRRHLIAVAGLLVIAVSASIFAYPLSVVALALLAVQIGQAISRRHQRANPAVHV